MRTGDGVGWPWGTMYKLPERLLGTGSKRAVTPEGIRRAIEKAEAKRQRRREKHRRVK